MSDEDVIGRLYELLQVGNLGTFTPRNPKHKPSWMLTLARREYIGWLIVQIAPLMSTRRRSAIELLAANFNEPIPVPFVAEYVRTIPDRAATAWLAGLIEGDGCIRASELAVQSVDRDVIERAKHVAGCGQIYFSRRQKVHHRDLYAWKVTSRWNIDRVLAAIEPWMLSRRTAAIRAILPLCRRKTEVLSPTQSLCATRFRNDGHHPGASSSMSGELARSKLSCFGTGPSPIRLPLRGGRYTDRTCAS
jgi:hypothetical protein